MRYYFFVLLAVLFLTISSLLFVDYKSKGYSSYLGRALQELYNHRFVKTVNTFGYVVLGSDFNPNYGNCKDLYYLKTSSRTLRLVVLGKKPYEWTDTFKNYSGRQIEVTGRKTVNLYCKLRNSSKCGCDDFLLVDTIDKIYE